MFCIIVVLIIIILYLSLHIYCNTIAGLCEYSNHLVGKVIIVTGASSGIGFATALDLAQRGARVIIANRNEENGILARDRIIAKSGNSDVSFYRLDLSSFESVRTFANHILSSEKRLDILINNAAVYYEEQRKTVDGILAGMQVNYFGPFLLTNLLLSLLIESCSSRIINVSSIAYKYGNVDLDDLNMELSKGYFARHLTYFNAKLCLTLMTVELVHRLQGTGVTVNLCHPGCVETNIVKDDTLLRKVAKCFMRPFIKSPRMGAQTSLYLAVSPELENVSGCYFEDCKPVKICEKATNIALAKNLWAISEKIVHLE